MIPLRRVFSLKRLLPALLAVLVAFQVCLHSQSHHHEEAGPDPSAACQLCHGFRGFDLAPPPAEPAPAPALAGHQARPAHTFPLPVPGLLPPSRGPPARS